MNKASKYGKKVPSYSQPDPWHLGENGSFFFPKEEAVARDLYSLGVCLCMSRGKGLIHRHWTLHSHSIRTIYIGSPYLGRKGLLCVEQCCHLLVLGAEH